MWNSSLMFYIAFLGVDGVVFPGGLGCMNRPVWSTGSQRKTLLTTWLFYKASQFTTEHEVLSHTVHHNVSFYCASLWLEMRRTQSFADVKVHCCLSLKVAYLSQRVTLKDPDFQTLATKETMTVPQQSWGINREVLTEMPLSKTAWKCHNVIRVFVICGQFIQAWQHIWGNLGKHLDLSFLQ